MLVSPECLYIQNASSSGQSKTLGHLSDVRQSGILYLPEGKNFLEGLLMLHSPECLYLQNAGTSGQSKTLGHLWDVSQSGILYLPEGKIF